MPLASTALSGAAAGADGDGGNGDDAEGICIYACKFFFQTNTSNGANVRFGAVCQHSLL